METEMTNELKAQFFALYLGQVVALITKGSYTHPLGAIHVVNGHVITNTASIAKHRYSLQLKPLSSITEKDAIEVAKITGCVKPSFDRYLNYLLIRDDDDQPYPLGRSGFTYKILFSDQSIELVINGRIGQITNQLAVFDYLRSKGYALSFMGISVEQQVQSGWVKLITDK